MSDELSISLPLGPTAPVTISSRRNHPVRVYDGGRLVATLESSEEATFEVEESKEDPPLPPRWIKSSPPA